MPAATVAIATPVDVWDANDSSYNSSYAGNQRLAQTLRLVGACLAVFALTAYLIASAGIASAFLTFTAWLTSFVFMGLAFYHRKDPTNSLGLNASFYYLMLFAASLGTCVGPTLLMYASLPGGPMLIAVAALICASQTLGLMLYASITEQDFSYTQGFLHTALCGLIAAGLVNWLLGSAMIDFGLAAIGIAVFSLYIMVDVQKIQNGEYDSPYTAAINLFLDIVNLFLDILQVIAYLNSQDERTESPKLPALTKLLSIFLVAAAVIGIYNMKNPSSVQSSRGNSHNDTPVAVATPVYPHEQSTAPIPPSLDRYDTTGSRPGESPARFARAPTS